MDSKLASQELRGTRISRAACNEAKDSPPLCGSRYTGTPILFNDDAGLKWMYDFALVSKQQSKSRLQDLLQGMTCRRRSRAGSGGVRRLHRREGTFFDPNASLYLGPTWPCWTDEEQINS